MSEVHQILPGCQTPINVAGSFENRSYKVHHRATFA